MADRPRLFRDDMAIYAARKELMPVSTTGIQLRNNPPLHVGRETGRNKPCPCGSGKKYKKCCMRHDP